MTIADLIRKADGKAGPWEVKADGDSATLFHYSTAMLTWNPCDPTDEDILDWSIGHGSVSDQNGMNTAFRILNLPYRFDRDAKGGGPRITDISELLAAR